VVDADGSNLTELRPLSGNSFGPDWSPDGSKLAFTRRAGIANQIFVMDADGGNVTPLSDCTTCGEGGDHSPTWSPDGSQIAFARLYYPRYPTSDLMVMGADGQNPHPVTSSATSGIWHQAWQPLPRP